MVLNRVEVLGQIDIDYLGHSPQNTSPDLGQGSLRRPFRSEPIGVRTKISLEDRLEDEFQGALDHPITNCRYLQHPRFAIVLGSFDFTVLLRLVVAREQLERDLCRRQLQSGLKKGAQGDPKDLFVFRTLPRFEPPAQSGMLNRIDRIHFNGEMDQAVETSQAGLEKFGGIRQRGLDRENCPIIPLPQTPNVQIVDSHTVDGLYG